MTRRCGTLVALLVLLGVTLAAQTAPVRDAVWTGSRLSWTVENMALADVRGPFRLYLDNDIPQLPTTPDDPRRGSVTDGTGARWTLSGTTILRNGVHAAGGYGSRLIVRGGALYTLGDDDQWWLYGNDTWTPVGSTRPVGGILLSPITCRTAGKDINCDAPVPEGLAAIFTGPHQGSLTYMADGKETDLSVPLTMVFMAPTGVAPR